MSPIQPETPLRNSATPRATSATGHLGGFTLLPAQPGTCPACAVNHAPELPHNQQSLYWQYHFYGQQGRWPTWKDAMAHCSQEMKRLWIQELEKEGIKL